MVHTCSVGVLFYEGIQNSKQITPAFDVFEEQPHSHTKELLLIKVRYLMLYSARIKATPEVVNVSNVNVSYVDLKVMRTLNTLL